MLRLTAERERRGWSRARLARMAEMSPAHVGQIELRRYPLVWPAWRQRLAQALGVDEAELFGPGGCPLEVEVADNAR